MLNTTSLKSLTVRVRILVAMRAAMTKGFAQYIRNRKGRVYLRVERVKGAVLGRVFRFFNTKQQDITETVYKALSN